MKDVWVVKVSGNSLEDKGFLAHLAEVLKAIHSEHPLALVHGGGKEIADLHRRLGVEYEFVEGLRVTSADGIRLVEMVLSGLVNTRLVRLLVNHGIAAHGVSGVDMGLIRVEPKRVGGRPLGFVGEIRQVQPGPLEWMLGSGVVPVVSPVSLGLDGRSYNVNADEAAQAIAVALLAQTLVFLTDVPGIMDSNSEVMRRVEAAQAEKLVAEGVITDGMIPKARSAVSAVESGVSSVLITDLEGLQNGEGTWFVPSR